MLGSRHIKFESHGRTEVLQFELLLNRGDQIWRFVFLDRHFGVSCHPKRIRSDNFEAGKKQIEIVRHNLFEPDEALEFVASLQLLCLRSLVVRQGMGTSRRNTSGNLTRAKHSPRSKSLTTTARLKLRFEI